MTSKISLFNKGIYKATIRRFLWGSVLYFAMLFLSTGMTILLNEDPNSVNNYWSYNAYSTIFSSDYMVLPWLMSIMVPAIVGLLVFRFIHSKKTSIFVHSMPVRREANFISSVLAALTLMAVPVMLNTIILAIMSVTTFSLHFSVWDCVVWMILNLFSLFVMFSAVCFVSVITGNSFASIGLNILFHTIALIIAATFTAVCDLFLYGFAGDGDLIEKVFEKSFITKIPTIMSRWGYAEKEEITGFINDMVLFFMIAVVLYVIAGFLYKKRRMETAEDVAGFKCLNPIFKYLVTFIGAISTFSITSYANYENPASLWVTVFAVSAIIYFGSEMLLKKSLRVWRSYKGYLGFSVAFVAMICIFAYTSFFGFETYVPENADVKSVAVYEYYGAEKPLSESEEVIAKAIMIHKELLGEVKTVSENVYSTRIHIEYTLENGKEVHRVYSVDEDALHEIMNKLYESEEYKMMQEKVFNPMDEIFGIYIYRDNEREDSENTIYDDEKLEEFMTCLKKDVKELSYNEIYSGSNEIGITIKYYPPPEDVVVLPEEMYISEKTDDGMRTIYCSINPNYTNTINWLRDNGYWESLEYKNPDGAMYIARGKSTPFYDVRGMRRTDDTEIKETFIKFESGEDVKRIVDFCNNKKREYVKEKDRYVVYNVYDDVNKNYSVITTISIDELKELFPEKDFSELN